MWNHGHNPVAVTNRHGRRGRGRPHNVTGQGPTHDVPISIIAHDPKVLDRVSGWGWNDGLRPRKQAPVWPMSAFRDRFLSAFDSRPATR